jgi:hypothetical protein
VHALSMTVTWSPYWLWSSAPRPLRARKASPGLAGPPGATSEKGDSGTPGMTLRVVSPQSSTASCEADEIIISAYCTGTFKCLPVGSAYERRALRQHPKFDNSARDDRLCETIVRVAPSQLGASWHAL